MLEKGGGGLGLRSVMAGGEPGNWGCHELMGPGAAAEVGEQLCFSHVMELTSITFTAFGSDNMHLVWICKQVDMFSLSNNTNCTTNCNFLVNKPYIIVYY